MHKPYDNVTMLIFELKCIIEHSAANVYEPHSTKECYDHIIEELEDVLYDVKDTRKKLKYLALSLENNLGDKTIEDLIKKLDNHVCYLLREIDSMHGAILSHGHDFNMMTNLLSEHRMSIMTVFNSMVEDLKMHIVEEYVDHLKLS